jgi:hypothetical protein
MSGVGALVLATILNVLGLAALRWRGVSSESALACLSVAYLVSGILSAGWARRDRAPRASILHALAWALALTLIYVQFLVVEERASLAQLIILQALAPLLSGFFSREVRGFSKDELMYQGGAFVILLFLARIESAAGSGSPGAGWTGLALLLAAYVASQSVLRSVVRAGQSRSKLLAEGCLIASALLGGLALFRGVRFDSLRGDALFGGAFGLVLLIIQLLYVEGIRRARGVLGNLALSGAVPISLLVNSLITQRTNGLGALLSLAYCGLLVASTSLRQRRARPV